MSKPLLIHLTSEVYPVFKRGGLADYCHSLTNALAADFQNQVFIPYAVDFLNQSEHAPHLVKAAEVSLEFMGIRDTVEFWQYQHPDLLQEVFVVRSQHFIFDDVTKDPYIVTNPISLYLHFAKSVLTFVTQKHLPKDLTLAILHDWQAFGVFCYPDLLRQAHLKTVGIIHNYEYQGELSQPELIYLQKEVSLNLDPYLRSERPISLTTLMLEKAYRVMTVSPNYAHEITHFKLPHPALLEASSRRDVVGFVNGVDLNLWSSETDPFLKRHFGVDDFSAKRNLKRESLNHSFGSGAMDGMLFSFISRFCPQKGIELFFDDDLRFFHFLEETKSYMVFVSAIDPFIKKSVKLALIDAQKITKRFHFIDTYTEVVAHNFFAASDALIMPSIYEPCGLSQLYALQYGTLPIVTPRGGLKDTISHLETGFVTDSVSSSSLMRSMREAIELYHSSPQKWEAMMRKAKTVNNSWDVRIRPYVDFFNSVMAASQN